MQGNAWTLIADGLNDEDLVVTDNHQIEFEITEINFFTDAALATPFDNTVNGELKRAGFADGGGVAYTANFEFGNNVSFQEFYRNEYHEAIYVVYTLQSEIEGTANNNDDAPQCKYQTFDIVVPVQPIPDFDGAPFNADNGTAPDAGGADDYVWDATARTLTADILCGSNSTDPSGATTTDDEYQAATTFTFDAIGLNNNTDLVAANAGTMFGNRVEFEVLAIDLFTNADLATANAYDNTDGLFKRSGDADNTVIPLAMNDEFLETETFSEFYRNETDVVIYVAYTMQAQIEPADMSGNTDMSEECKYRTFKVVIPVEPIPDVESNDGNMTLVLTGDVVPPMTTGTPLVVGTDYTWDSANREIEFGADCGIDADGTPNDFTLGINPFEEPSMGD